MMMMMWKSGRTIYSCTWMTPLQVVLRWLHPEIKIWKSPPHQSEYLYSSCEYFRSILLSLYSCTPCTLLVHICSVYNFQPHAVVRNRVHRCVSTCTVRWRLSRRTTIGAPQRVWCLLAHTEQCEITSLCFPPGLFTMKPTTCVLYNPLVPEDYYSRCGAETNTHTPGEVTDTLPSHLLGVSILLACSLLTHKLMCDSFTISQILTLTGEFPSGGHYILHTNDV